MKKLQNNNIQWYSEHLSNYDSYTFKQNDFLMNKPVFLGFADLE